MYKVRRMLFFAVVTFMAMVWSVDIYAACPKSDTLIVIYNGGGIDALSRQWIGNYFVWWRNLGDSRIQWVTMTDAELASGGCSALSSYSQVKLFVAPGGNAYNYHLSLGSAGKTNINNFINAGGGRGYLGICAGYWYTMNGYYWEDTFYAHANLLNRTNSGEGWTWGLIPSYPNWAKVQVWDNIHGGYYNQIYYGGPSYGEWYTYKGSAPGQRIMDYESVYGWEDGDYLTSAQGVYNSGNKMLLFSTHPEAYNYGVSGLTDAEILANWQLLAREINYLLTGNENYYTIPTR
jgi:hypothetical protein